MRMFFGAVGVLAWISALAVLWIFAESGGALTIIAAGIYAIVAMVALGCERIIKTLEQIRDGTAVSVNAVRIAQPDRERVIDSRQQESLV